MGLGVTEPASAFVVGVYIASAAVIRVELH
jgi:hypothetical protein